MPAAVLTTTLWLAVGAAPAIVALIRLFRAVPAGQDEVWFLLVATRLVRGRRLYTEVFYGAGPLPVWAAAALVRWRGAGLRTMRTLTAALLIATTVLLLLLVATGPGRLAVLGASVAMAGLVLAWPPDNTYGVAARAGAVLAVVGLAASDPDLVAADLLVHPSVPAVLSGLGLVVALFAKHTLGAAAALTVLPGWILVAGSVPAATAAGTTALGSAAVLALLARRRELHGFVHRTLLDKGAYLATGRLTFTGSARRLMTVRPAEWWVDLTAYAVTVVAALACPVALAMGTPGAAAAVCLAAVSVVGTYPRADPEHVRPGALLAIVALILVLRSLPVTAAVVLTALALLGGAGLVASWRQHPRRAAEVEVAALDGLPMLSPVTSQSLCDGRRVREMAGRRILVLRSDAAQWYLALDLRNPTAYDYPLASTFGSNGQEVVAQRLRRGDVEWCLFAPTDAGALAPTVLEEAVRSRMDPVLDTALGVLLRARHP